MTAITEDSVVTFKDGICNFHFWGDNVTIPFWAVDVIDEYGDVRIIGAGTYHLTVPLSDLEHVADIWDAFTDCEDLDGHSVVHNADAESWWWHVLSDEDREDRTGPYWIEWV